MTKETKEATAWRRYLLVDGVGFRLDRQHAFLAGFAAAMRATASAVAMGPKIQTHEPKVSNF